MGGPPYNAQHLRRRKKIFYVFTNLPRREKEKERFLSKKFFAEKQQKLSPQKRSIEKESFSSHATIMSYELCLRNDLIFKKKKALFFFGLKP